MFGEKSLQMQRYGSCNILYIISIIHCLFSENSYMCGSVCLMRVLVLQEENYCVKLSIIYDRVIQLQHIARKNSITIVNKICESHICSCRPKMHSVCKHSKVIDQFQINLAIDISERKYLRDNMAMKTQQELNIMIRHSFSNNKYCKHFGTHYNYNDQE